MVRAYVLLTVEIGKVEKVLEDVKAISGVIRADAVTGPYDAIVHIEAADLGELTRKILHDIHNIDGVIDTTTAIVVEVEEE
ncbi:Lrp/AsnC family transcriptional regulator [Thermococci archaeon]|uniref:Lrp/AsnC family transcriptional regulator n=1 Tax=Palaeococcus sp. (in: euryarchaeotes) TaxID=2820298 RepID=UPI000F229620|nr:Lrp/AsnC ligand binding domain-containing protein [Palaeococcus sp. (in: euryarchaeotes)]MCD6560110.1 Lrp/AsnC ligand binding domain-containing protein [Palaeococcus sp. (in: euryarchaeotes)]RLF78661.1 MAG: Lrp/AsnC family transcriptional regulator [Thermococci archaeon]RLF89792.1 MAG: Lrp/AsnC family transcriptional regulator [Thermococci archaeon]